MYNQYPYIPNLSKVLSAFDDAIGASKSDEEVQNDYVSFLKQEGILRSKQNMLECSPQWDFMLKLDSRKRQLEFGRRISEWPISKVIIKEIGDGELSIDDITEALQSQYASGDIRVLVSWLESSGVLKLSCGKFKINLDEEAEDIDSDSGSIYPLSYKKVVDIQNDKYSVFDYLRKISKGMIVMNPDFQRHLVWNDVQKSQFIESAILNIPIPPIYLKKNSDTQYIVVDGLQRTSALKSFVNNKFRLTGLHALDELNGKSFSDLENEGTGLTARIEDKQLMFYILQPTVPMSIVYDIFNRINTGGTKLERQEIRNCIFIGKATTLLKEIAEHKTFRNAIDNGISGLRMKDREAVLRCLSFVIMDYQKDYNGSMDEFLEMGMKKINIMSSVEVDDLKKQALRTYSLTFDIFKNKNFRIPTEMTRGRINIAVMESVFRVFWPFNGNVNKNKFKTIKNQFVTLLSNISYQEAVSSSTGSKSNVKTRFEKAQEIFTF